MDIFILAGGDHEVVRIWHGDLRVRCSIPNRRVVRFRAAFDLVQLGAWKRSDNRLRALVARIPLIFDGSRSHCRTKPGSIIRVEETNSSRKRICVRMTLKSLYDDISRDDRFHCLGTKKEAKTRGVTGAWLEMGRLICVGLQQRVQVSVGNTKNRFPIDAKDVLVARQRKRRERKHAFEELRYSRFQHAIPLTSQLSACVAAP